MVVKLERDNKSSEQIVCVLQPVSERRDKGMNRVILVSENNETEQKSLGARLTLTKGRPLRVVFIKWDEVDDCGPDIVSPVDTCSI